MALNAIHPRPTEQLTDRNQFRTRQYTPRELLGFSKARDVLPQPVLPDNPGWVEMYWRAWELAWSHLRRPSPKSGFIANYLTPGPDSHLHMWESAFTVMFGLYGRRAFTFINTLDNFYAKQLADGFIGREFQPTGQGQHLPFDPNSTGPNILAWVEWNYYRVTGDDSRLATVFWPLMAFHRWLRAHRTWPSRLYWATGLASGLDNQARVPGQSDYHHHWTWVDANMQASLDCLILGKIAQIEQENDLAQELTSERAFLIREVNERMWQSDPRFYLDIGPHGEPSPVKSIAAYWALLDKEMVPAAYQNAFVQHLREPEEFNRPHRIPSQAADSAGYHADTGNRWQGAVWAPTNYMVLKGLRAHKHHRLAHQIAMNHLEHVFQVFRRTDTFWENYAPEGALPGSPAAPNYVGWTGLSPIAILLEDIIGIEVDWPLKRIIWDRRLQTGLPYGVRNYPLGARGILDLVGTDETIEVKTNRSFTLTVIHNEGKLQTAVPVGTSTISY